MMKRTVSKWLASALAVAMLVSGGVWSLGQMTPAAEAQQSIRYWWQLVNERGRPYPQGNAVCQVYRSAAGENPYLHLYTSVALTSHGTSPLLGNANGVFEFFSLEDTVVNVICWTKAGDRAAINRLDKFTHTIVIDRSGISKVTLIPFHLSATTVNSGVYIPAGAVIRDVIVHNLNDSAAMASSAQSHLEVGFRGNHAVAANVGALVAPMTIDQKTSAAGTANDWLYPRYHTAGALVGGIGYGATHPFPHLGLALQWHTATGPQYRPYIVHVNGGLEVTWRTSADANMNGHIYILWEQYHVGANAWTLDN